MKQAPLSHHFRKALTGVLLLPALMFGLLTSTQAAGLLIAEDGFGGVLEVTEHTVDVTINNGIAVTTVDQVFLNTENRQLEALYTFPVPKGASVANFSMWIGGKEMTGEVLEKKRAREIYDSYKRRNVDPGLLEQVDYKTFEMRVFPILAGAEQRVQITYYQELEVDHDWATYVYPLATVTRSQIDQRVQGKFAVNLEINSAVPIKALSSPSHASDFAIVSHSPSYAQASLEMSQGSLARDVVISCKLVRPRSGLDLIASKPAGEDGYFLLNLVAGEDAAEIDVGMDYVFVLDVSGSMAADNKLGVSHESIEAFVDGLGDKDHFDIMTFNVAPKAAFGELRQPAGNSAGALNFLRRQPARGGTTLAPALDAAYRYARPDRTLNVVILSDGMTEQKERAALLQRIQSRPANSRVFCIGVGNEINRPLLQQLAERSGGLAAFLSRGDDFERQAAAFRRKLMRPAISNLSIDFKGAKVYDLVPEKLPDLYHGVPVRVYGRYKGAGPTKVGLTGTREGLSKEILVDVEFPKVANDNPEVERMWAWHRMNALQKEIDRTGQKGTLVDEMVRLGEGYSIVSQYTSFLVLENDAAYKQWKIERKNALRTARDRKAQERVRRKLDQIRNVAATEIGPDAVRKIQAAAKPTNVPVTTSTPSATAPPRNIPSRSVPTRTRGRSVDFDLVGSGPVGPFIFIALAWMGARRRKK